jgi:dihydroflavonol-4-reductase
LKAFVTGGTGFVGRRLLAALLDHGWEVRALVRESEMARLPKNPTTNANLTAIVGDVSRPESLRGTMDDVDAVFHLAALVDAWSPQPWGSARASVEGTDHVIEETLRAAVPRFIFTTSIFGTGLTQGGPTRENSPPVRLFGAYRASRAEVERHVAVARVDRGLPAITLIPSIVIGPGDTRNSGRFLLSYVKGEFLGTFAEDSVLPVVGVDDVARAHILSYHLGVVGARYIISAENVVWREFLKRASLASGTPMPSRHIGGRALWLASRTDELMSRITRSPPRLPVWLADFMRSGASMDNSKSVQELGIAYRPISESIEAAIDWFRDAGLFEGPEPTPFEHDGIRSRAENPRVGGPSAGSFNRRFLGWAAETGDRRPKPPEGPA